MTAYCQLRRMRQIVETGDSVPTRPLPAAAPRRTGRRTVPSGSTPSPPDFSRNFRKRAGAEESYNGTPKTSTAQAPPAPPTPRSPGSRRAGGPPRGIRLDLRRPRESQAGPSHETAERLPGQCGRRAPSRRLRCGSRLGEPLPHSRLRGVAAGTPVGLPWNSHGGPAAVRWRSTVDPKSPTAPGRTESGRSRSLWGRPVRDARGRKRAGATGGGKRWCDVQVWPSPPPLRLPVARGCQHLRMAGERLAIEGHLWLVRCSSATRLAPRSASVREGTHLWLLWGTGRRCCTSRSWRPAAAVGLQVPPHSLPFWGVGAYITRKRPPLTCGL
jgi:hypothetical protein